jgi:hypothetical protein
MCLPQLTAGGICPVTRFRVVSSHFSPALGAGPAYPVGLASGGLQIAPPSGQTLFAGSG